MLRDLLYRLRALFRHNRVEGDLDGELAFHLEHERQKYLAAGLPLAEAERRARLVLGGLEQVKEELAWPPGSCLLLPLDAWRRRCFSA